MRLNLTAALLATLLSSISYAELTPGAAQIVEQARQDCASFESGKFSATDQAVRLFDFTGDGYPEEVVDASQFACSSALTLWGGTGGTFLWVVVNNQSYEFLAHKWRVVDFDGQNVLLIAVHPSECSDTVSPCYRSFVWSDGFKTTRN